MMGVEPNIMPVRTGGTVSFGQWLRRLLQPRPRAGSHRKVPHSTQTFTLDTPNAAGRPKLLKRMPALTPREQDVVRLVCLGYSNKQIAQELGIKVTTVKWNMTNILAK